MNIKKFVLVFFILLVIVSYNYLNSNYKFDLNISLKENKQINFNNQMIKPKISIQDEIKELAMEDNSINIETIEQLQDKVSFADKTKILKLILTNLTTSDIDMFKNLALGGITEEEKEKAVSVALDRYNEQELELIKELYFKYMK